MKTPNNFYQSIPAEVAAGERLRASTINGLRAAIGRKSMRTNDLEFEFPVGGFDFPFRITQTDTDEVTVLAGDWYRNGYQTIAADTTLSGLTVSTTHYIVATLSSGSGENPEVKPDTLTITAETTWTPPADIFNIQMLLGIVVMGAATMDSPIQLWWGGNKDDFSALPDANASSTTHQSLELRTDAGHIGESSWYGFSALASIQNNDDMVAYINTDGTGAALYYAWPIQIDDGSGLRPRNSFDGGSVGFDIIEDITGSGGSAAGTANGTFTPRAMLVDHARLEIADARTPVSFSMNISSISAGGGGITWDTWDPDVDGGPHHDQTDPTASLTPHSGWAGTGSQNNGEHDDRFFQNILAGGEASDFDTTGAVTAGFLSADNSLANTWDATDLFVDVSGTVILSAAVSILLDAGTTAIVQAAGNATLQSTAANVIVLGAGDASMTATTGDATVAAPAGDVFITAANNAVMAGAIVDISSTGGDITATPSGNFNVAAGVYEHLGTSGISTFGHSGGIFTDETAWNAAVESKVNDVLAGWGLI